MLSGIFSHICSSRKYPGPPLLCSVTALTSQRFAAMPSRTVTLLEFFYRLTHPSNANWSLGALSARYFPVSSSLEYSTHE